MKTHLVRLAARSLCLSFALAGAHAAASPTGDSATAIQNLERHNIALEKQLADMEQQLLAIKQQLAEIKQQSNSIAGEQQNHVQAEQLLKTELAQVSEAATQAAQLAATRSAKSETWDKLSLWGYGEAYYTQPTQDKNLTQADLARAVFGIGYQFDDKTRFNSEYEVEHAVSSASDPGEFEVEQFYVDHQINDKLGFKAGLFLIPAGFLNENHEPTNFYGVQRNFVETLIIPSTWREGGIGLHGSTDTGFDWNLGMTTGLDLSKWNFAPTPYRTALELEDNDIAPMQAAHQELALANASHPSAYAALNYRGIPGVTLGGTYFTGGAVAAPTATPENQRVTLWETHARYQPGKLDVEALYAHGSLTNTAAVNAAAVSALSTGVTNPMPASFDGWFAQAAYNVWQSGGYRLAPFVRYEKYDMGASYEGIAPANFAAVTGSPSNPAANPIPRDTVDTIGANFYLNPNVVFKFDYQKFHENVGFSRFDMGMGLQF